MEIPAKCSLNHLFTVCICKSRESLYLSLKDWPDYRQSVTVAKSFISSVVQITGGGGTSYSLTLLNRNEFVITDTELKLIAAAAMIGLRSIPKNGYRTPAAIGTPMEL